MIRVRNSGAPVEISGVLFASGDTDLSAGAFRKLDKESFGWWCECNRLELLTPLEEKPETSLEEPQEEKPAKKRRGRPRKS